jgi:hypothetical protein
MSALTVVFLKDTGHVLAALTRADPPAPGEPVGALVDTGLPLATIDGTTTDVTIPVGNLDAVTVDDQPEVLLNPQGFQVIQDPQKVLPPKVTSVGVGGSTVTLSISTTNGAAVKVTVTGGLVTSLTAVVVLQNVTTPSPALIVVRSVTVGSSTVVDPPGVYGSGEKWNMYAFVQGLVPQAQNGVLVT